VRRERLLAATARHGAQYDSHNQDGNGERNDSEDWHRHLLG
jgi:hypothetical protein